jgi:hypothetical protein
MHGAVVSPLILLTAVIVSAQASAQTSPGGPGKIATNIAGISAFAVPPANFNPLTATAAELEQYGFPPRPSRLLGADALARWQRRVRDQTRIVPELVETNTFHGPARTIKQARTKPSVIEGTSENWSGVAIVDKTNPFSKPTMQVEARFVVPKPVSGCKSGTERYSSANWVGIDGAFSNDVLQAGTETDLNCASGATYYAWIEWYPNSEVKVSNLPVSGGDLMSISVFIASDGGKHLSVENLTAQKSVSLAMQPPPGTKLIGNSIEWIVERPTIDNKVLSELTDFLLNPWSDVGAVVLPGGKRDPMIYLPNAAPASATIYHLSMSDGKHELGGVQLFSIPAASKQAAPSLWFFTTSRE